MTEQEAIEVLKHLNFCGICTTGPCGGCERKQAKEAALIALEEVQQYRNIERRLKSVYGDCDGLLEKVVEHLEKHENIMLPDPIFKARLLTDGEVDGWEEYKAIGTVEECREAKKKQRAITPITNPNWYACPECGSTRSIRQKHSYCHDCGQALKWS